MLLPPPVGNTATALRPASTSPTTSACRPRKSAWPNTRRRTSRASSRLGGIVAGMTKGAGLDNSHLNGYRPGMAEYSVAEAKNNLPKLLARVQAGEDVTITKRGKPIARIVPQVANEPVVDAPKSWNDIDWIRKHRAKTKDLNFDSAKFIRQMRDDYRY